MQVKVCHLEFLRYTFFSWIIAINPRGLITYCGTFMKKKYLAIALSIILPMQCLAAKKITFSEAIDLAVKNNLEVKASYEAFKASQLDKESSRAAFFPKVSASLSYEKSNIETVSSGNNSTNDGYTAALSLSQNLFNGFSDYSSLKIADANIKTSEANLQETKAQISYDLKTAVADTNFAQDSLNLSKDILKRREDNLRLVELRFENGRENKGSVLLSKAYLEQAKLDLLKAQNAMNTSLTFLRRVLNLPENATIEVEVPTVTAQIDSRPNFNSLIENTPISKRFKATLESSMASVDSKKSGFLPTWGVTGSVGRTGSDFFPNDQKNWRIGSSLSWDLFSGGKDYYASTSAILSKNVAEKRLENQTLELRRSLQASFDAYEEAIVAVKVSSSFLEASKVRADISRSKYNNGLTTFDDWDLIENDLINRQKDYNLKIKDRLTSEASWEQAQGTGVIP